MSRHEKMRDVQFYLVEAKTHLSKAESRSKARLNIFRRSSRLCLAAQDYCKPGILYYKGGSMDESRKVFLLACECYKGKKAWYSAAKTLEQAMVITTQQNNFETLVDLSWKTAALYDMARQPDQAALILARSGSVLKCKYPDQYIAMMYKAAEIVAVENRFVQAATYLKRVVSAHINENNIQRAVPVLHQIIEFYAQTDEYTNLWQTIVKLTLLMLLVDEYEKVNSLLHEYSIVKGIDLKEFETLFLVSEAFNMPDDCERVYQGLEALKSEVFVRYSKESKSLVEKLTSLAGNCRPNNELTEEEDSSSINTNTDISVSYSLSQPDTVITKEIKAYGDDTGIVTNLIHPSMNPNVFSHDKLHFKDKKNNLIPKFHRSKSATSGM